MALNYKYTRLLAFSQTVLGFLSIVFGVVDRVLVIPSRNYYSFPSIGGVPIWMGVWFLITGILGIFASRRSTTQNTALVGTYCGFSITSVVFAGTMLICYAISLAIMSSDCRDRYAGGYNQYSPTGYYTVPRRQTSSKRQCQPLIGIGSMLLLFAVLMFGLSIWAAICCCMGFGCSCCNPTPAQPQVVYLNAMGAPPPGYVVVQGPSVTPIAVPAQAGGPMMVHSGTPVQTQAGSPMVGQGAVGVPVSVQGQPSAPMMVRDQGGHPQVQGSQMVGSPGQPVYLMQQQPSGMQTQQFGQPAAMPQVQTVSAGQQPHMLPSAGQFPPENV